MANTHILIVDDSEIMRKFLGRFLEKKYKVSFCDNGLNALEWLKEGNTADLFIIDLDMPGMNGIDFINQIRRDQIKVPVLTLSAIRESDKRIECLEAGADDFVTKPFHPSELDLRITSLLNYCRKRKASAA